LVHHQQNVLVGTRGRLEWSHRIKSPYCKGQDGGIVLRTSAGTWCCLVKNWQPLHRQTRS
jgi:hypothetical protein